MKQFPNGFSSWQETHFEIVSAISYRIHQMQPSSVVWLRNEEQGQGGLYELAEELTDEFENIYQGVEWDGNYMDTIEQFINVMLA